MSRSNKFVINLFRGLIFGFLLIILYKGLLSPSPNFSKTSAWGDAWGGLFLSSVAILGLLETSNWFSKKTRIGHLPASFWGFAATISGTDVGASLLSLFEIPYFDNIVHYSLSGVGAIIFLILFRKIFKTYLEKVHWLVPYYLAFATVNVLNVFYEIGEMIGDKYYGSFNITSQFDTGEDFVFNNLGILTVLLIDLIMLRLIKRSKQAS